MSTTSTAAAETTDIAKSANTGGALPLDLVELELALDGFDAETESFTDTLRSAAKRLGGEYLFDLPASGLAQDCRQIATLRVPADDGGQRIVFALLDDAGTAIRVQEPTDATQGLKSFAEAFVTVIETLNTAKAA